jgi:hypothetical protein
MPRVRRTGPALLAGDPFDDDPFELGPFELGRFNEDLARGESPSTRRRRVRTGSAGNSSISQASSFGSGRRPPGRARLG